MLRAVRSHLGLRWAFLGLVGSATISVAATGLLSRRPDRWWWEIHLGSHGVEWHVFWAGVVLLCLAWLGLGLRLRRSAGVPARAVAAVAALWSLPLWLAPALFSLDLYSYLAQGSLLHHGLNPYRVAPNALSRWHETRLLSDVSSNWRGTTAPYGPVFLALAGLVSSVAGGHVPAGVTLVRLLELPGLALLAIFVPRLARRTGADPARAVWLALASPLTLLYLVGGGHNDALMIGLVVAGAVLALEGRPLLGIGLCALAAAVKLPGAAGAALIAICWLWAVDGSQPGRWRSALRRAAAAAAVSAGIVIAAGAVTGVGLSWISGGLFSTPASVHLAITPSTAVAVSIWEIGHHGGPGVGLAAASLESAARVASFALVGIIGLALCWRVRFPTLVRTLGLLLLLAALGGPAAWPWYVSWGIVVLAAERAAQRSRWLTLLVIACAFAVMAGGQVAVALPDAPRVLALYAAAAAVAMGATIIRRRHGPVIDALAERQVDVPSLERAFAYPNRSDVIHHESAAVPAPDPAG